MASTKKIMSKYFIHIHEHTLELNDDKAEDYIGDCFVCGESISNWQYCRCSECPRIRIHHYPCSEIPIQIDHHPFHPPHRTLLFSNEVYPSVFCDACGRCCFGAYKCGDCDFVLDVKCALLTNNSNNHHHQPNHFHPLISCENEYKNFSYTCCYCKLRIDVDWVYLCLECKGFLHHSCAELPWKIEHLFHSLHPLLLLRQGSDRQLFECSVCCEWGSGFAYHCLDCGFVLDFHCAGLKPEQAQTQIQIQQFTHPHPLVFCKNFEKFPFRCCYACGLSLTDSIYFCPECSVLLHESCADLPPQINNLLHPHHTLTLRNNPRSPITLSCQQQCGACLSYRGGIFYECSDCKWYMHVRCAFLSKPTLMRSKIHRHPLALVCGDIPVHCYTCSKLCQSSIPFFRCVWCNVNQHVHCISALPPTLKYNNHVHPLTLTYRPIKDRLDEDDNAEFCCDACEQRRDLALPTFYCKDGCQFVAHPRCVVSEIIHSLEEEWSKHGKVEELRSLTLKEFLDSFAEDENKEVQGLFEAYKRSVQVEKGKILLCLYEDEDEDEDEDNKIDMIMVLMKKFVSEVEVTLPWENWDSTSKVIEDGNYMILENRVSILEALLSKYGDFSKSSRLGTKATMLFTMTVCEAVHNMCSTKIRGITTSQLLIWLHSCALAQYAGFEIQFVIGRLTELVHTHFGLQADDDIPVDLELAKVGVPITTQLAVVDSKELTNIEEDGETDDDLWKKVSWQLTIMKLDEAIEDLEKKKQALLKMQEVRCLRNECVIDVLELEGHMAGTTLL